jgi:hypothetical protein
MNIDTLFTKTDKGQSALTDKYVTLPHSLKRALIIVDGQRNVSELHTMAPLYDDLDESLQTLLVEGFIQEMDTRNDKTGSARATSPPPNREAHKPDTEVSPQKTVKWRLISLLQVELGSKLDPQIKAAAEKMIRDISGLDDEYDALSKAWKKCVKVTKITIDEELAEAIRRRGEELLAELNN